MSTDSSRDRILRAARDVARESGAGRLSLDAVAAKAGLSKGGLLYNYPSKAKLLQALVQQYLDDFDASLGEAEERLPAGRNRTALAFLDVFQRETELAEPPPSGLLAAIADDMSLLDPGRAYFRRLLDRMTVDAEADAVLVAYLAVEGLRSLRLFETDTLTDSEKTLVMDRLRSMLSASTD